MNENLTYKAIPAEIFGLRFWVQNTNSEVLKTSFDSLLQKAGFTVLKYNEHHFPIQGYTGFWLLAESHLAIHTFPQNEWSYIELSSCNKEKTENFELLVRNTSFKVKWSTDTISVCEP